MIVTLDSEIKALNWARLESLTGHMLGPDWTKMVLGLKDNVVHDGVTYFGFYEAPAASGNHHAYCGGLVKHLLEMWDAWQILRDGYDSGELDGNRLIHDASVFRGILLHDLHKAWVMYIADPAKPSGLNYGQHPATGLLLKDQRTIYIVQQAGIKLDLVTLNMLYHSEGGWADSPPKWGTTYAKLSYLLADLSGNVLARNQAGNILDIRSKKEYSVAMELWLPV